MKVRFSHWLIPLGPVKYCISVHIFKHNIPHFIMFNKIIDLLSLSDFDPNKILFKKYCKASLYADF